MTLSITDSFGLPLSERFEPFCKLIGATLPKNYQEFLTRHNGGRIKPDTFTIEPTSSTTEEIQTASLVDFLFGFFPDNIDVDLDSKFHYWKERVPTSTVPIGQDPGGNLILIGISSEVYGQIFYWDRNYEVDFENGVTPDFSNIGFIASDFIEFLKSLHE
jgi:hypothetical protein